MSSTSDTGKARRRRRKPANPCFRQTKAWADFPVLHLEKFSEDDCKMLFRKLRWSETDGEPVCPWCGSTESWWLDNQQRWKCRAANCRKLFSITSRTAFSNKKLSFKAILIAVRAFIIGAKGCNAIEMAAALGCQNKTAYVLQHKLREVMLHDNQELKLEGEVEVDGGWFGGYIKPENRKINRVDRRLKENLNGKRKVVVGARERGKDGRTIVGVFDTEYQACAWLSERIGIMSTVYADEAPAWDDLHASHKVERVNHSEEYARGEKNIINTNQMESFYSRMRRFEIGTHHSIAGPYLARYAADAAWRETNRNITLKTQTMDLLREALKAPPSRSFSGLFPVSTNGTDLML